MRITMEQILGDAEVRIEEVKSGNRSDTELPTILARVKDAGRECGMMCGPCVETAEVRARFKETIRVIYNLIIDGHAKKKETQNVPLTIKEIEILLERLKGVQSLKKIHDKLLFYMTPTSASLPDTNWD